MEMSAFREEEDDEDDGPNYKYYRSERLLGRLFRAVDEKKIWEEEIRRQLPEDQGSIWDQFRGLIRAKIASLNIANFDFDGQLDKALQLRNV